ncbi:MAG: 1,2-phenylacetyl-CoA epoxidase subunit PaaC [Chitinophagaceae bacterium]
MNPNERIQYILHLADNNLIAGHRLSEWCGHGPILEVDIALANLALDQIGNARALYQYAASLESTPRNEDYYPYQRTERDFRNILLVEQPIGDFAFTIAKSLYFDTFQYLFYSQLLQSKDAQLAAIAEKTIKEVAYHKRFSSEWAVRLGDGTTESNEKMQTALHSLWDYTGEMFEASDVEALMQKEGIAPALGDLKTEWLQHIQDVVNEGKLTMPKANENGWFHKGGKKGLHSEHMGFILAEMQYMQRAFPNSEW